MVRIQQKRLGKMVWMKAGRLSVLYVLHRKRGKAWRFHSLHLDFLRYTTNRERLRANHHTLLRWQSSCSFFTVNDGRYGKMNLQSQGNLNYHRITPWWQRCIAISNIVPLPGDLQTRQVFIRRHVPSSMWGISCIGKAGTGGDQWSISWTCRVCALFFFLHSFELV